MIHLTSGDMFERAADIRINTVNCVGVMGAGVALAFKQRYPEMFREYARLCKAGQMRPGRMHVWKPLDGDWIVNFPTKRDWREPSRYEDIDAGLADLRAYLKQVAPVSVAIPALGCGHGGLEWDRVRPMIEAALEGIEGEFWLYEPSSSRSLGEAVSKSEPKFDLTKVIKLGFTLETINLFGAEGRSDSVEVLFSGASKYRDLTWIAVMPSKKPEVRELGAMRKVADELRRASPDARIGLIYTSRASEDVANEFLSAGLLVVLILPFGVTTHKSALSYGRSVSDKLISISLEGQDTKWSRETAANAQKLMLSGAAAILITDPNPEWLSTPLLKRVCAPISHIRYEGSSPSSQQALMRVGSTPIGRSNQTGAPHIASLLTCGDQRLRFESGTVSRQNTRVSLKLINMPEDRWDDLIRTVNSYGATVTEIAAEAD